MQLYGVPRTRGAVLASPSIHRRAQAPEAPTLPSLIDVTPPDVFDPLTALTTGDESEHCGMQGIAQDLVGAIMPFLCLKAGFHCLNAV